MKTVTQTFKDSAKQPRLKVLQEVYYKRRYWVQSSRTFTWETNWTRILEKDVESVAPVNGKLDTERLNEFKISNLMLTLKNLDNAWGVGNTSGKFGGDSASPLGYEPYWTKFQVKFGFVLYEGTEEVVTVFTGYATDFVPQPDNGLAQIRVDGPEVLLMNADAERVSTEVSLENIGTGNGSNKDFTTAQPGVGIIELVSVAGITKKAGSEYTISQDNDLTLGAKITFVTAPANGTAVLCTYRYWKQSQKVESLVADLATEAGIAGANQSISTVLFPSTVNNTWTQTTQADFTAGTNTDLDVTSVPGSMRINFDSANQKVLFDGFGGAYTWTDLPLHTGAAVAAGRLQCNTPNAFFYKLLTKVCGVWQFNFQQQTNYSGSNIDFMFLGQNITFSSGIPHYFSGYKVRILWHGSVPSIKLDKHDSGDVVTNLATVSWTPDAAAHDMRISRDPNGVMRVYLDGAKIIEVTDNTYTSSSMIAFLLDTVVTTHNMYLDDVYVPKDTLTAEHVSQVLDMLAAPVALGLLRNTKVTAGGAIDIYTRTGTANPPADAYVAIGGSNQIGSSLKRYGQVKISFSCASTSNSDPRVDEYNFEYKNTVTLVALANFTGKTCFEAIQDLGKFANYEWGFKADETFFFRPKNPPAEPQDYLDWSYNLLAIEPISTGFDKAYSEVQASYGDFDVILKSPTDNPSEPGARLARKRLSVDGGGILVATDVDVASGIAGLFLNYYGKPRKRFRARCKLMPHVDNGDTLAVTFRDGLPNKPWHHGAISVQLGDNSLQHFGTGSMVLNGQNLKVISFKHDRKQELSEFELEEILS